MSTGLMAGKRGLIMGLANDKSIAWGIAKTLADHGAEMAFSYQGEALKKRVDPLIASIGMSEMVECDVGDEASIDALFAHIGALWGKIDFLVHAIGFSDKNELRGRYVETSKANFAMTMDISVYSFTSVCRRACAMMPDGGRRR
jgi:enoyl-[acyl-carrier protein] reductase I